MNRLNGTEPAMTARPRQAGTFRHSDSLSYHSRGRLSKPGSQWNRWPWSRFWANFKELQILGVWIYNHRQVPAYIFRGHSGKSVCIFSPSPPHPNPLVTNTMDKAKEKERGREGEGKGRKREREGERREREWERENIDSEICIFRAERRSVDEVLAV